MRMIAFTIYSFAIISFAMADPLPQGKVLISTIYSFDIHYRQKLDIICIVCHQFLSNFFSWEIVSTICKERSVFFPQAQWWSCKSKHFAENLWQEQMMLCYSHSATLTNAVQLVDFNLQTQYKALMVMLLIAIRLISLEVVKLETAKILKLDQNQLLPEISPYPILTGSEESGSKLDHQMDPSSNALLMVG